MDVANPPTAAQAPKWDSIEELFAALESPLLGYALRLVGERSTAEDLVQDAFMKLHAQFDEVREPQRWLYRAVHNAALNHRRDSARLVSQEFHPSHEFHESYTTDVTDETPLPDAELIRLEGIGLVRLSMETLDERSRELIRLKFHEDLSYQEMSARTGLSPGLVGYTLHHALKTMADELARAGVIP